MGLNGKKKMDFDDILDELGELGRFQITTYMLICLPVLFSGANSLSYVFTAGIPNYRCFVPNCDSETNPVYEQDWMEYAIPNENKNINSDLYKPALCSYYALNSSSNGTCGADSFLQSVETCDRWVFDGERTIVNDFMLTCRENQWRLSVVGNSHFVGIFIGTFIFGVLSDRFGRKYVFLTSIFLMCVSGVAHVVATNYIMFVAIALLHAIGTAGVYPLGFVIGVELVGRKKREFTGVVLNFFYAIGEALLGVAAWLLQDWTYVQLVVSGPNIIFLLYICIIPESVRWLMAKKKHREASGIIHQAAKINNVILSKDVEDSFQDNIALTSEDEESVKIRPMVAEIMRSKVLVLRYIIMFFVWAANAFIYYGLSLNSTSMIGNKYLNFILVCLIEIPGYLISWIAILKVGRKYSLIVALFVCSINCAASLLVSEDLSWLIILLFLTGKLSITASFGIIYVYTAEIFPTIVRSGGVATASMFGRLGAFLAPYVPLLGFYFSYLPMLLFSTIAALAGIMCFKLPETLNKKLPETTEEAINI